MTIADYMIFSFFAVATDHPSPLSGFAPVCTPRTAATLQPFLYGNCFAMTFSREYGDGESEYTDPTGAERFRILLEYNEYVMFEMLDHTTSIYNRSIGFNTFLIYFANVDVSDDQFLNFNDIKARSGEFFQLNADMPLAMLCHEENFCYMGELETRALGKSQCILQGVNVVKNSGIVSYAHRQNTGEHYCDWQNIAYPYRFIKYNGATAGDLSKTNPVNMVTQPPVEPYTISLAEYSDMFEDKLYYDDEIDDDHDHDHDAGYDNKDEESEQIRLGQGIPCLRSSNDSMYCDGAE